MLRVNYKMTIFNKDKNWKVITLKLSVILAILLIVVFGINLDKKLYKSDSLIEYLGLDYDLFYDSFAFTPMDGSINFSNPNATLTIVEFIDYESPFSKKFHKKTYQIIKEKYIDTGLINYVIIDNPLFTIHKKSMLYAQAIHCADEQNMSELYYNLLLSKRIVNENDIYMFADNLSLNQIQFNYCIDTKKYEFNIFEGIEYSKNNNIIQTPTLIIDDIKIEGLKSSKELQEIIDKKLNLNNPVSN